MNVEGTGKVVVPRDKRIPLADTPFTKRHLNIWPVHTGTMAGAVKEKTFYNP